jgi:flagellar L-ring protein precursor FlgH
MNKTYGLVVAFLALFLEGCVPSTSITHPLTARPQERKMTQQDNGAIYQSGTNERPLFEDRRARNIGDVLTIVITEVTTATEKSASNSDSSGSLNVTMPNTLVRGGALSVPASGSSSVKSASKSDNSGNNAFTGTITVTVIEVLANGNLLVSGEKQVSIKYANEYVRFSGVVNPNTITYSNTVPSTQVADVHVEYKGANSIDAASIGSMFSRVFYSVLPF